MHKNFRSALCGALCVTASVFAAPVDVLAAPPSAPNQESVRLPDSIASVYYRRHYRHYRYGYRYDPSGAIFAGAALGLVGAGVAAATQPRYYGYPGYGWGW